MSRYKRKCKEMQSENQKLRKDLEEMKSAEIKALQHQQQMQKQQQQQLQAMKKEAKEEVKAEPGVEGQVKEEAAEEATGGGDPSAINLEKVKNEPTSSQLPASGGGSGEDNSKASAGGGGDDSVSMTPVDDTSQEVPPSSIKSETDVITIKEDKAASESALVKELRDKVEDLSRGRAKEQETLKELKAQLKKAQNDLKEMKLLLDMYKACTKEQREKTQIMVAEKKARAELEETRQQLKKVHEAKKEEKKKMADEDASKRIRHLEEQCSQLQKQVANHKQEEEALLSEMEVTGTAFEDMQEQNSRLIQQLREKDDANFKLMSERIKSNQIQRLAREERDMLIQQVNTLTTQVEAQNQVVRKLEEKERLLQNNLQTVDKELSMRQQAMEMHKRKAIESAQSAADLKLHLEKYHAQIKEVQQTVAEKTSALEAEAFKTKRLNEELVLAKRKVERLRKIEMASDMDEILKEEIREYKETLTCPSCKVKRKDAVLTKCFHCFCYDCLRTRYETRQRKCPKCNAAFGASDYHRLYLA